MRIGFLMQTGVPDMFHQPLSGPANHVKHVIRELIGLGHHVRLVMLRDGKIWQSDDMEGYKLVETKCLGNGSIPIAERAIRRAQNTLQIPYLALFDGLRFAHACEQVLSGFDILYERMGWMGYGGALASRWLQIPWVLEVNGDHLSEMEALGIYHRRLQRLVSSEIMKTMVNQAAHIVAAGSGWKRRIIERWKTPSERISVVENGSEVVDMLSRNQLRAFSECGSSAVVNLIYVGAFEPWSGLQVLLNALSTAVTADDSLRLTLIGSGSQNETVQQRIHGLGIEDRVKMTGWLWPEQLAAYLAQADIGLSPYCGRVEFSGLKLLDYKSAGLAVIASGENEQPSVLKHGRSGWIVPPCDEEALCNAMVRLAADDELRRRMGRQARLEAEQYHSWRHTAEQLVELFQKLPAIRPLF